MLQQILRWSAIGGIFAIPIVIPFIVASTMFFPYITGKNFTFRIIVEVILAAWVVLAFLDARYRPRFSWVLAALTVFTITVGVADLLSANPFKSFWSNFERMEGYITILHMFAFFVVASTVLNTERLWNAFWYSSLGASVVIAFVGLGPVVQALSAGSNLPRIDATFGNPIYLAVYALFHIFIAFVLMARWRGTWWHQVFVGAIALLHIVTMFLTLTRGTVLGFLGGAVITTLLIALLERERKGLRTVAMGALLFVVVAVGAAVLVRDTEWAKTTPVVNRFTQISLEGGTVEARFMNWGMAWQGVQEQPFLGWGQGNYEYIFSKHYDPMMYGEEPWFDRTHNIFFDWLVSAGFLGLIAYLLIPLALLVHLWVIDPHERQWSWKSLLSWSAIRTLVKKRDDEFPATERALWTGLLAAYMFHNLFVFDNLVSYILYASLLAYLHWRVTQGHDPLWRNVEVREQTVHAVVLPVAMVLMVAVIWVANVPGIKTSQLIIEALVPQVRMPDGSVQQRSPEDMLAAYEAALAIDKLGRQEVREQLVQRAMQMIRAEGVSAETKERFRALAETEIKREIDRNPDSARLWLFYGSFLGQTGKMEEAETAFERAVELTPTKQTALQQLAEVKLLLGKNDEAVELTKRAYELATVNDDALKVYALALIRTGNDKEAVDLLTERYDTPAVDDTRLFMGWVQANRYDIAAQILEQRVETNPDDVQQVVSLAAAYRELGQVEQAITLLENTKEAYPEYADQMDQFISELRTQ